MVEPVEALRMTRSSTLPPIQISRVSAAPGQVGPPAGVRTGTDRW